MKNVVPLDVTSCGSSKNRRFGGNYRLHHQCDNSHRTRNNVSSVLQLAVAVNIVPSSLILLILMMEMMSSSETPVLTRGTRRPIPEDDSIHLQGSSS
jgi:hypothetical protein